MSTLKRKKLREGKKGYTLVELTVVIVILGVLATISFLGFGKIQADTRDKERTSNAVILSEALEKYYDKNGEYPSVASITTSDAAAVKAKLGLSDADVLVMPKSTTGTTNSITATDAQIDKLAYNGESVNASESDNCLSNPNGGCDQFSLQWVDEQGEPHTIPSRHEGRDVAQTLSPPSDPVVDVTYVSSVIRATASGSVCAEGTLQYKIAINTTGATPDWNAVSWQSTSTKDQSSPVAGTTYYGFAKAQCVSGATGAAENPTVAQDNFYYAPAGTPSMAASWSGANGVGTLSTGSPCAGGLTTKYYVEYRITTTAAAGSWIVGNNWTTTNNYSYVNASSSNPRKFDFQGKIRCDNGGTPGVESPFSNIDTLVSAPVAPSVTNSSNASATYWYFAATCPVGTSPYYRGTWTGNYNAYPAIATPIYNGYGVTSSTQGFTYGLTVTTSCGTPSTKILSVNSADSTYNRPVNAPPFEVGRGAVYPYRSDPSGHPGLVYARARVGTVTGGGSCASGTYRYLFWRYNVDNYYPETTSDPQGRYWSPGTIQDFYYNADLQAGQEFEARFILRCYNNVTGQQGANAGSSYIADRYGNMYITASDGHYRVGCDQGGTNGIYNKNPTWCQTGYNQSDTSGPSCSSNSNYCWGGNRAADAVWSWYGGTPVAAPYNGGSNWATTP